MWEVYFIMNSYQHVFENYLSKNKNHAVKYIHHVTYGKGWLAYCCYSSQLGLLPFAIPNPTFFLFFLFSSPGHRPCELLSWVSVRRPSVRPSVSFSHLNLLLWNRWTEISQTCQKCSLDGPLPDLCFWCWFEIQHGCQGP
jgi:hypothetical protein